jgi:hypothetical protein
VTIYRLCPKCGATLDPQAEGRRGPCKKCQRDRSRQRRVAGEPGVLIAPPRNGRLLAPQPYAGTATAVPLADRAAEGSRFTTSAPSQRVELRSTCGTSSRFARPATISRRGAPPFFWSGRKIDPGSGFRETDPQTRGRKVPELGIPARTCERCGDSFQPKRLGRPRRFCAMCTPRSDEDRAAAREHWARVRAERARQRNAEARAQIRVLREREAQRVYR